MRDYLLLLMALVLFIPILTLGMCIHIYKDIAYAKYFSMRSYAYNIALHLDEAGGAMLFNSEDHTISAMCYEKEVRWAIALIDWIFRDSNHCYNAWIEEFDKGKAK